MDIQDILDRINTTGVSMGRTEWGVCNTHPSGKSVSRIGTLAIPGIPRGAGETTSAGLNSSGGSRSRAGGGRAERRPMFGIARSPGGRRWGMIESVGAMSSSSRAGAGYAFELVDEELFSLASMTRAAPIPPPWITRNGAFTCCTGGRAGVASEAFQLGSGRAPL